MIGPDHQNVAVWQAIGVLRRRLSCGDRGSVLRIILTAARAEDQMDLWRKARGAAKRKMWVRLAAKHLGLTVPAAEMLYDACGYDREAGWAVLDMMNALAEWCENEQEVMAFKRRKEKS